MKKEKYIVDCGKNKRKKFDSLEEASRLASKILKETGIVVGVFTETKFKELA